MLPIPEARPVEDLDGGYPADWFLYPTHIQSVVCSICQNISKNPVTPCEETHCYCQSCWATYVHHAINEGRRSLHCAVCRQPAIENPLVVPVLRRLVHEQESRCTNDSCEWTGNISELVTHKKKCRYERVQCDLCNAHECERGEVERHWSRCPKYPIPCDACKESIRRDELREHKKRHCRMTIVRCTYRTSGCNAEMTRDALFQHSLECGYKPSRCEVPDCKHVCLRKDMEHHMHKEAYKHFLSIMKLLKDQTRLSERIVQLTRRVEEHTRQIRHLHITRFPWDELAMRPTTFIGEISGPLMPPPPPPVFQPPPFPQFSHFNINTSAIPPPPPQSSTRRTRQS